MAFIRELVRVFNQSEVHHSFECVDKVSVRSTLRETCGVSDLGKIRICVCPLGDRPGLAGYGSSHDLHTAALLYMYEPTYIRIARDLADLEVEFLICAKIPIAIANVSRRK